MAIDIDYFVGNFLSGELSTSPFDIFIRSSDSMEVLHTSASNTLKMSAYLDRVYRSMGNP